MVRNSNAALPPEGYHPNVGNFRVDIESLAPIAGSL